MDKIIQIHKTYKPTQNHFGRAHTSYYYPPSYQSNAIEFIGQYNDPKYNNSYMVVLLPETVSEEEKTFDFDSKYDIEINSKIELNGEEYSINNKKYNLDGSVVYYIEDKLIKCDEYDDLYEKEKEAAKQFLKDRHEEYQKYAQETEESRATKKSIWWYLGFR